MWFLTLCIMYTRHTTVPTMLVYETTMGIDFTNRPVKFSGPRLQAKNMEFISLFTQVQEAAIVMPAI